MTMRILSKPLLIFALIFASIPLPSTASAASSPLQNVFLYQARDEYYDREGNLNAQFMLDFLSEHQNQYDFVVVYATDEVLKVGGGYSIVVRRNVSGIDPYGRMGVFTPGFEKDTRLKEYAFLQSIDKDDVDTLVQTGLHEISHYWLAYLDMINGMPGVVLNNEFGHWNRYLDTSTQLANGKASSPNGGAGFISTGESDKYLDVTGVNVYNPTTVRKFHSIELYLMGILSPQNTTPFSLIMPTQLEATDKGLLITGEKKIINVQDVISTYGERSPAAGESQNSFSVGFVLLTNKGESPTPILIDKINQLSLTVPKAWYSATNGLSKMNGLAGEIINRIPSVEPPAPPAAPPQPQVQPPSPSAAKLIKARNDNNPQTTADAAVYLLENGQRKPFLNEDLFHMYFASFSSVVEIGPEELASIPLGTPVLPPAGTWIKITSVPKVYEVQADGKTLRWIPSEEHALILRGAKWNENIKTIDVVLYSQFITGESL